MRVFVTVLALFALACQQTPRYKLVERGGQTLRVDAQTGETHRLEAGKWVAMPTSPEGTPPPKSSGLSDDALGLITVKATTTSSYGAHITIDNGSDWDILYITLNVNGESVSQTMWGSLRAGQRASFDAALSSPIQGKLYVDVMSAQGTRSAH